MSITPNRSPARPPAALGLSDVVQRDDGLLSIGWHDEADGPFESRAFAAAVAAKAKARSRENETGANVHLR